MSQIKILICSECGGNPKERLKKSKCEKCYIKNLKKINPEYKERQRSNVKKFLKKNPEKEKEYAHRKYFKKTLKKFGIPKDRYYELLKSGCEICSSHKSLNIDHDHDTGLYRGILCNTCNRGLGMLGDTIDGITAALNYLTKEKEIFKTISNENGTN